MLFHCFSFLKTRLVWFCLNLVISAFQFKLVLSFSHKQSEPFTKFTSHLLFVLLPGNSFWLLSTMLVAYCILQLISPLFPTYFPPLLLLFPYFSFLKTRLVWYCPAFQLELFLCFPLKFTILSLNILRIYFWLCSLETPSVSCLPCSCRTTPHDLFLSFSLLISAVIVAFPLFLLSKNETYMVLSKHGYFRISI